MSPSFDRDSTDAVIQDILTRMAADRETMLRNHSENRTLMSEVRDETRELKKDFNGRVRALEQWRNYLTGAGAAILGILGWIIKIRFFP